MNGSLECFTCNGLIMLNNSNILIHTNFVVSKFDILFILMRTIYIWVPSNNNTINIEISEQPFPKIFKIL